MCPQSWGPLSLRTRLPEGSWHLLRAHPTPRGGLLWALSPATSPALGCGRGRCDQPAAGGGQGLSRWSPFPQTPPLRTEGWGPAAAGTCPESSPRGRVDVGARGWEDVLPSASPSAFAFLFLGAGFPEPAGRGGEAVSCGSLRRWLHRDPGASLRASVCPSVCPPAQLWPRRHPRCGSCYCCCCCRLRVVSLSGWGVCPAGTGQPRPAVPEQAQAAPPLQCPQPRPSQRGAVSKPPGLTSPLPQQPPCLN